MGIGDTITEELSAAHFPGSVADAKKVVVFPTKLAIAIDQVVPETVADPIEILFLNIVTDAFNPHVPVNWLSPA